MICGSRLHFPISRGCVTLVWHDFGEQVCIYLQMYLLLAICHWLYLYSLTCLTNHRSFLCFFRDYNSLGMLLAYWDELMSLCMYAISLLYNINSWIFNPAVFCDNFHNSLLTYIIPQLLRNLTLCTYITVTVMSMISTNVNVIVFNF